MKRADRNRVTMSSGARTAAAVIFGLMALWGPLARGQEDDGFAAAKGRVTFRSYCATCHGADGTGDGSVAEFLSVEPADLTRIIERDGEFPAERLRAVIDGREEVRGHGDREMPVWGTIFRDPLVPSAMPEEPEERAARMIDELVRYLRTIQVE